MNRVFALAKQGIGKVNPNPLVGAVIVKNQQIIGEGYHERYGGPHAEVNALGSVKESPEGASMYVNLEPCSHYGKTPPCVEAIVAHKIKRVIVGELDPNPEVSGRGVKFLKQNNIEVEFFPLNEEEIKLNEVFKKFIQHKIPYVILKTAMTIDGKIASHTGDSRWISGKESREMVHELRNELTGIMIGVDTAIADDPMLTTRLHGEVGRNPIRIVLDTCAKIPLEAKVLNTSEQAKTILAVSSKANPEKIRKIEQKGNQILYVKESDGKLDLHDLMKKLGDLNIDGLLLEGGSSLNYSALKSKIVDEVIVFIAPKIIGGATSKTPIGGKGINAMKNAIELERMKWQQVGKDLMLRGKPTKPE